MLYGSYSIDDNSYVSSSDLMDDDQEYSDESVSNDDCDDNSSKAN